MKCTYSVTSQTPSQAPLDFFSLKRSLCWRYSSDCITQGHLRICSDEPHKTHPFRYRWGRRLLSFQFCIVTCFHLWPVFLMLPFKEDLNWTFNLLNTEPVFVVVQSKMWSSTCTPTIMDVIEDIRSVASQSRTEHGFVCLLKGYRFGNLRKIQNKS